jgi:Beta-lactamase enzyme family
MEQMIIHSDNTASDMLIDLVGTAQVNAVVAGLVPQGFGRITSAVAKTALVAVKRPSGETAASTASTLRP